MKSAPAFSLLDTTGKQYNLADHRGKIVILNFWAFWCDTWKAEMPHLRQLAERRQDLGFELLAISVDGSRVEEFHAQSGGPVPFPVLLDSSQAVSASYQVAHVPTVFILDKEGRIRFSHIGYPGNHVVLNEIRKLSAQQAGNEARTPRARELAGASRARRR